MRRRRLLAGLGVAVAGSVAGCTGGTGGAPAVNDETDADQTPAETDAGGETETGESDGTEPGGDEQTATDGGDDTETDDGPNAADQMDGSLERTGDCGPADLDTATVRVGDGEVTVEGCIQGRNGCMQASLASVGTDGGTMTVVVETTKEGGDVCSQQLVYRGYRVTTTFDGSPPDTVQLIHDSMDGRRTVTTTDA